MNKNGSMIVTVSAKRARRHVKRGACAPLHRKIKERAHRAERRKARQAVKMGAECPTVRVTERDVD
jgi:hypothetical protein